MSPENAYLELLKRSILNEIYLDDELRLLYLRDCLNGDDTFDYAVYHDIRTTRPDDYEDLQASRQIGRFPKRNIHLSGFSHTMIGRKRLDNVHKCLEHIRKENIPGDLMECGVWRGGACIFMAGYLKIWNMTDRKVILADSFDGLPAPTHEKELKIDLSKEKFPELAVSQETVEENFRLYDLLDENIVFLKGWFKDTLMDTPAESLALLRLDGDYYESTLDGLTHLYDKVVPGGAVIIDDYGLITECKDAVHDFFFQRSQSAPEVTPIDLSGVFWIKD